MTITTKPPHLPEIHRGNGGCAGRGLHAKGRARQYGHGRGQFHALR